MITLLDQSTSTINHYKLRAGDSLIVHIEQYMEGNKIIDYIIKDEDGYLIDSELEEQLIDYITQVNQ